MKLDSRLTTLYELQELMDHSEDSNSGSGFSHWGTSKIAANKSNIERNRTTSANNGIADREDKPITITNGVTESYGGLAIETVTQWIKAESDPRYKGLASVERVKTFIEEIKFYFARLFTNNEDMDV